VPVSWFKVFGYPTGVGCLVARRGALARLWRPWFAGGTIQAVSAQGDWHALSAGEAGFEDGTLSFHQVPDVAYGLSWVAQIGIEVIQRRVSCLTGWLLSQLAGLRHGNGQPMVRIYGPAGQDRRGGTVAFSLLDPRGQVLDGNLVARDASAAGISIRTGCFCNPGTGEAAFGLGAAALASAGRAAPRTMTEYFALLGVPAGGALRASVGLASNLDDVERLLALLTASYRDRLAGVTART
jgi:selenocysteine lyase/cysteine desulfurase